MKKLILILLLIPCLSYSQTAQQMYDSLLKYKVYEPQISLCIIIFETGLKPNGMLLKRNNLFAFNSKNGYIRFESYKTSIISYLHYQQKYWLPYKIKYPNKNYYDFLLQSGYARSEDMPNYIKQLKLINKNLKAK